MEQKTVYEFWFDKETEHGSFVTALFNAYRLADPFNKIKLTKAYPEYFCDKFSRPYEGPHKPHNKSDQP